MFYFVFGYLKFINYYPRKSVASVFIRVLSYYGTRMTRIMRIFADLMRLVRFQPILPLIQLHFHRHIQGKGVLHAFVNDRSDDIEL